MLNNKFLISGVLLLSLGCGTARRFDIAEKKVLTPSPEQQSQGGLLGQNGFGQGALDVSTITGNKDPKSLTGLDQLEGDLNSKVAKLDPKNLKGNLEADLKGKINTDIPNPKAELDSKMNALESFGFGEESEEIAKVDGIRKDVQNLGNISADQVGDSLKDNALDSVNSKTTKIVNGIEYNIADSEEIADTVSPGATVRPKATARSATQGKFYVQVSADTES